MDKEIITFGNSEVERHKFHQHKIPISLYDVNISKIVVSNKVPFGENKYISSLIKNDEWLEK